MQITNHVNAKKTYKQHENKIEKLSYNKPNGMQCQIDCTIMRNSYNEVYMKNQILDQPNINEN